MRKRISLSVKLIITMMLLLAGIIGLCWILNHTFLERFYIYEKKQDLLESFYVLEKASETGVLAEDDFDVTFENLCANDNLNILVVDMESKVVRASMSESRWMFGQLESFLQESMSSKYGQMKLIEETEDYTLLSHVDSRLQSEYLVLYGALNNGGFIFMRTALESIRDSAAITNRFFLIIGLFGILVGAVVIFFIARGISRPVRALTDVSKAMSELKFEVKYEPKKMDTAEFAELGEHINFMSNALEKTITDLKAANNELKKDIEKKDRIDEMRKEFLSNVSHELKTPIALIQGYAEGLRENINEDAQSRDFYCDVIVDESDKMNKMVQKLLILNQLEFGNDQIEMSRFNITEMITGLVQSNLLLAHQEGIRIVFDEEPEYVWGDEFKVEEVLTNYLSNAMHHAQGEKIIRISYEKKDALLRICVFNTGSTLPEDELKKIWDKFYKVDKARTREYGGSGIGLSIVRAIMEAMHQACGVRNLENGIEFWMELENSCTN